jgi:hypothetical protein
MAGKVVVSTLNNDTGVLATQNGMTGIPKAWCQFTAGGGNTAGVINGSFNISSITVNSTGNFTANFTTALADINYSVVGSASTNTSSTQQYSLFQIFTNATTGTIVAPTTSAFRCTTGVYGIGGSTPTYATFAVFGN